LILLSLSLVPQAVIGNALVLLALRAGVGVSLAGTTGALAVQARLVTAAGKEGVAFGAASTAQSFGWGLGPLLGAVFAAVFGIPALHLIADGLAALMAAVELGTHRKNGPALATGLL
jgi:hypothetical protein